MASQLPCGEIVRQSTDVGAGRENGAQEIQFAGPDFYFACISHAGKEPAIGALRESLQSLLMQSDAVQRPGRSGVMERDQLARASRDDQFLAIRRERQRNDVGVAGLANADRPFDGRFQTLTRVSSV